MNLLYRTEPGPSDYSVRPRVTTYTELNVRRHAAKQLMTKTFLSLVNRPQWAALKFHKKRWCDCNPRSPVYKRSNIDIHQWDPKVVTMPTLLFLVA